MSLNISGNRWSAFADFRNCHFCFMDPAGSCLNKTNYVFTVIAKKLEKKHINDEIGTKWPKLTVKNLEYPIQKNSFNCRYIIYIMQNA